MADTKVSGARYVAMRDLTLGLFEVGAFRFGEFTLTSGRRSNYYLNMRFPTSLGGSGPKNIARRAAKLRRRPCHGHG